MAAREALKILPTPQEQYGRRLIPNEIDRRANSGYKIPFAAIPRGASLSDGYMDVSFAQLARAVNYVAFFLERRLGQHPEQHVFAYIGPTDIRYHILAVAAAKAGHVAFFLSSRNSLEGQLALLDEAGCNVILRPSPTPSSVKAILAARALMEIPFPELSDILRADAPLYPFEMTVEKALITPFIYFHTSGSTGIPKLVPHRLGMHTVGDLYRPETGMPDTFMRFLGTGRISVCFPFFHIAGLGFAMQGAVFHAQTIVCPLPNQPMTADHAASIIQHGCPTGWYGPPSILHDMANDDALFAMLTRLDFVCFAGGPLPQSDGDKIIKQTKLYNIMGSSESMWYDQRYLNLKGVDWVYFDFGDATDPARAGFDFRPVHDDMFEMVIVRDDANAAYQGHFITFPNLKEFPTKDVYSKHPSQPGLYLYRGRIDDVIVFSNGEKLNPVSMEQTIMQHPQVDGALVVGQGRFQAALIIEAKAGVTKDDSLLDSIWQYVQLANQSCPAHGKVARDLVIFTTDGKPFVRAGKNTIQRPLSVTLYDSEIHALFDAVEKSNRLETQQSIPLNGDNSAEIEGKILTVVRRTTGLADIDSSTDFLEYGLDSLHITNIARELNKVLGAKKVSPRLLYSNHSVMQLAGVMVNPNGVVENRSHSLKEMFGKYSTNLPDFGDCVAPDTRGAAVVVLTGSTGSLGSFILDCLLSDATVEKIYCLNRKADAQRRQESLQSRNGLNQDFSKVVFITTTLSEPRFGLEAAQFGTLLQDVTHILHNAWTVDFNIPLSAFAPHFAGLRRLVDFQSHAPHRPALYFISSISAVSKWHSAGKATSGKPPHPPVPELPINDWDASEPTGYGESKLVAENILANTPAFSRGRTVICRVGQIAGPVRFPSRGMWPRQEWLPSLIASSRQLRILPDSLGAMGTIDWVPVDHVASAIVELALLTPMGGGSGRGGNDDGSNDGSGCAPRRVNHIVNPHTTSWAALLPVVLRRMPPDTEVVPLASWVVELQRVAAAESQRGTAVSAVRLLSFFEDINRPEASPIRLDTVKTSAESRTLKGLAGVGPEWMEMWLTQWEGTEA